MKNLLVILNVALLLIVILMYMHGMANLFEPKEFIEPLLDALTPK